MEKKKKAQKKIMCACQAGGHLTEMLILTKSLGIEDKVVYITDKGTADNFLKNAYFVKGTGKLRNLPFDIPKILYSIIKERPKIIISTGAELGIVAIVFGKIFLRAKTIYIECSAQVKKPSYSGRIVYPFADIFFVQWEPLLKKYGKKAKYGGNLILGDV
ncbi:MAG: PssD/Cps14F family polysaccharide biosynthesis glycosyltransferase [bacterium]|nr:PssD/Cps14F family polysaccharide biosynthesis glycosyltransferase [bacterium]